MRRKTVIAMLGVLAGLAVRPVRLTAQQDSTALLPPIVVSAHRHPTPRELVTARVTVLDGERLRARGIAFVGDALRSVPGLHVVESGSFGAATSVFLRGGESDYVKVLVDGVPVNEPGGSYDFAHLTTDNVERIEIVRGPTSVVYGSDAVTGVVNVITKTGAGTMSVAAGARGGTYGTLDLDASLSGGSERAAYAVQLRRFTSDGAFAFNNAYRNTSAAGRLHVAPDERTDVSLTARYADAAYHFPTDGAGVPVDSNQFTANETTTLGLEVGRRFRSWLEARVHVALHEVGTLFDDQPDGPADTVGFTSFRSAASLRRRRAEGHVVLWPTRVTAVTAGVLVEQEWQRADRDRTRDNRAYYAELVAGPVAGLAGTVGLRLDDNERFGEFLTFRTALAYRVPGLGARLHASAGTAFKEPTFLETFDGVFSVGNPDLAPERSRSLELGAEQPLVGGRLVVAATVFDQHFDELIQFTPTPAAPGAPNYRNVAAADARGIEAEFKAYPVSDVQLSGSYTYLETAVTDSGFDAGPDAAFVVGERLLRRPAHAVAVRGRYQVTERVGITARFRHVGARDDRDFGTFPARRVTLPAYSAVDVSLTAEVVTPHAARPGLTLSARIENLLDAAFQEIAGFPGRGRTVLVGGRVGY